MKGPEVDWEYIKTLHPVIHAIHGVTSHVEKEFNTLTRGKKHTVPQKKLDVQKLQDLYSASKPALDARFLYQIWGTAQKLDLSSWPTAHHSKLCCFGCFFFTLGAFGGDFGEGKSF